MARRREVMSYLGTGAIGGIVGYYVGAKKLLGIQPDPTEAPTETPTEAPTETPTEVPTETPTEVPTETPTEVPTETPTDIPEGSNHYQFNKLINGDWLGSVRVNNNGYLVQITHNGDSNGFGQALRSEPMSGPTYRVMFDLDYTRNSIENNLTFGITADIGELSPGENAIFDHYQRGYIEIINRESQGYGRDTFELLVTEGNSGENKLSSEFTVTGNRNRFEIEYDGSDARAFVNGEQVASLPVMLEGPLYGGISLEADSDTIAGEKVTVKNYHE